MAKQKCAQNGNHQRNMIQNHRRYHLILVRVSISKNATDNKCCKNMEGKREPLYIIVRKVN